MELALILQPITKVADCLYVASEPLIESASTSEVALCVHWTVVKIVMVILFVRVRGVRKHRSDCGGGIRLGISGYDGAKSWMSPKWCSAVPLDLKKEYRIYRMY